MPSPPPTRTAFGKRHDRPLRPQRRHHLRREFEDAPAAIEARTRGLRLDAPEPAERLASQAERPDAYDIPVPTLIHLLGMRFAPSGAITGARQGSGQFEP